MGCLHLTPYSSCLFLHPSFFFEVLFLMFDLFKRFFFKSPQSVLRAVTLFGGVWLMMGAWPHATWQKNHEHTTTMAPPSAPVSPRSGDASWHFLVRAQGSCLPLGYLCNASFECCSGECNISSGLCSQDDAWCLQRGQKCTRNSDCCSSHCDTFHGRCVAW